MKYDTIIIGGGAAGMMAGIFAARKGLKVCIVEHMDRVGKKILSTGNGKCNITNMDMTCDKYYDLSQEDFNKVIGNFMPEEITAFFKELGLLTINKNGYIYPHSEQASTVLDFLRNELDRLGVQIYCDAKNAKITKKIPKFIVVFIYALLCIIASIDSNLGYVLLMPLGAILFMSRGQGK
mgnify:CR=1 FL=1